MSESLSYSLPKAANVVNWDQLDPFWQSQIQQTTTLPPSSLPWIAPHTQVALTQTLQYAHSHDYPILICGNGTKLHWGGLVQKPVELVVSTQQLNRIIEHAVGDLTVTVEAGVKLADLQEKLREVGQFLPLDPAYPDKATIGGIIATADSGSWRQRYGGVRDLLLGVTFVRADGTVAKAGGRVVKNVAGYDLMKLFTGSYGTLGVISQATLRVYPLPEASATLLLTGDGAKIAQITQLILNSSLTPTVIDLISDSLVTHLDIGKGTGLLLRFQSIAESVTAQAQQVEKLAQELGLSYQNPSIDLWQRLAKVREQSLDYETITCKIGIARHTAHDFLQKSAQITNHQSLAIIHAGSGLGKLRLNPEISESQITELRLACQQRQGFLTVLGAPKTYKKNLDVWGYNGNSLTLMEKIKQQFDPNSILNPGRFLGKI